MSNAYTNYITDRELASRDEKLFDLTVEGTEGRRVHRGLTEEDARELYSNIAKVAELLHAVSHDSTLEVDSFDDTDEPSLEVYHPIYGTKLFACVDFAE
jgi:hypothetical protein